MGNGKLCPTFQKLRAADDGRMRCSHMPGSFAFVNAEWQCVIGEAIRQGFRLRQRGSLEYQRWYAMSKSCSQRAILLETLMIKVSESATSTSLASPSSSSACSLSQYWFCDSLGMRGRGQSVPFGVVQSRIQRVFEFLEFFDLRLK
jgi:hypothetical protein